jgi:hypothetical protein
MNMVDGSSRQDIGLWMQMVPTSPFGFPVLKPVRRYRYVIGLLLTTQFVIAVILSAFCVETVPRTEC